MNKHLSLLIGSSLLAVSTIAMAADAASAKGNGKNKNSESPAESAYIESSCTLSAFSGISACTDYITGNNSNQDLSGLFDIAWEDESLIKAGIATGEIKVDNGLEGSSEGFSFSGNKQSGTWELKASITDNYQYGMFVVKAGNSFASYFWDGLSSTGTWDTLGVKPNGGGSPDLSHFSFYGFGQRVVEPEVPTIPEPATFLGLLVVGGAIAATRRKKLQQA
jgi:hypothetical protein